MFDLDRFKGDCCAAATGGASQQTIREIVARADDGLLLEVEGSERITVSYQRITAIDAEQASSNN